MSAPVWVVAPVASAEQAASITFTKPSGLADGDVLVVALRSQGTRSGEIALPTGWIRGGSGTIPNDRAEGIFYKAIPSVAAESATSYAFGGLSSSTSRIIGSIGVLRGADLTNLNDGGVAYDTDATLASTAAGGIPYTVVALWGAEFTAGVSVVPSAVPSGFTNLLTAQTAGGSSPSTVLANSNTTGSRTGMVLASTATETGSTTVPSLVTTWPSAPTDPKSAVWIVRGKVAAPAAPRGFDSVAEMRAKRGATWAHRGGSASYTEHSLAAYAAAAARGYGVLELSLQRTSDGVWFGCHDLDLARVTGNAALTQDVRTMTWAQVNSYQMTIGSQAPQPFMRWQDFIAAGYGNTHVLVLDPKNSVGSYQAEFLAMVAASVDPARVIMKWAGGLTSFADAAKAAGFKTAGYWYQADYDNGNLAAQAPSWDYLGMDYTAGTAWTGPGNVVELAAAQGKKVWGHIAPDQAAYDLAMSKGADMVQVSGVAVVAPVSWWTIDATLTGSGSTTAAVVPVIDVAADLSASGSIFAPTGSVVDVAVPLSGAGALTAVATGEGSATVDATLSGSGSTTAVVDPVADVAAALAGAGLISVEISSDDAVTFEAALSGSGSLQVVIAVVVAFDAALSGSGSMAVLVHEEPPPFVPYTPNPYESRSWPSRAPGAERPYRPR